MSEGELVPHDLTAEPKAYVFLQPGWAERLEELAPRVPEYCNVYENFPCLGNHPADTTGRRRDEYTFSSVFNVVPDRPLGEWRFGPFRFAGMQAAAQAELRRLAEVQDRAEWIEGVRRRLGLVAEVHRCWVWWGVEGTLWTWWCYRLRCPARGGEPSQPEAFAAALAHVRSFIPEPPEEELSGELDWEAYKALAVLAEVARPFEWRSEA